LATRHSMGKKVVDRRRQVRDYLRPKFERREIVVFAIITICVGLVGRFLLSGSWRDLGFICAVLIGAGVARATSRRSL
jgi:uncharacterized membrane protein